MFPGPARTVQGRICFPPPGTASLAALRAVILIPEDEQLANRRARLRFEFRDDDSGRSPFRPRRPDTQCPMTGYPALTPHPSPFYPQEIPDLRKNSVRKARRFLQTVVAGKEIFYRAAAPGLGWRNELAEPRP